jgi:ribosomal protein S25
MTEEKLRTCSKLQLKIERRDARHQEILKVMRGHRRWITPVELTEKMDISSMAAGVTLRALAKQGLLDCEWFIREDSRTTRARRYRINSNGRKAIK